MQEAAACRSRQGLVPVLKKRHEAVVTPSTRRFGDGLVRGPRDPPPTRRGWASGLARRRHGDAGHGRRLAPEQAATNAPVSVLTFVPWEGRPTWRRRKRAVVSTRKASQPPSFGPEGGGVSAQSRS